MPRQIKVSVIIPVYNAEPYLAACVDSVLAQTLREIEVILINDGSTDASAAICDAYAQRDCRVRVVHQKNAGAGLARNAGIDLCVGQYIAFVDSDDYIEPDMCRILYEHAVREQADLCCCGFRRVQDGHVLLTRSVTPDRRVYRGQAALSGVALDNIGADITVRRDEKFLGANIWATLFSADVIRRHALYFKSEREFLSEDGLFKLECLLHAGCVCTISDTLYNYRVSPNSLSSTYCSAWMSRLCRTYREQLRMLRSSLLDYGQAGQRAQRMFLMNARVHAKRCSAVYDHFDDARGSLLELMDSPVMREVLTAYPWRKTSLKYRLFNLCFAYRLPHLLYLLCRFGRHTPFCFERRNHIVPVKIAGNA